MAEHGDHQPLANAAVIGCGVIGAGWVARARLRGVDVCIFDPSDQAPRVLDEVYDNAASAWRDLDLLANGRSHGELTIASSISDAVRGSQLVVEAVPERLGIKHETLTAIDTHAPTQAIIASSTSGFRPTALAEPLTHPERLVVGHPFNPVYLLPLVEVVAGQHTAEWAIERVCDWYAQLGMKPLRVRKEIDAHIADRLLEAVWREALWLVNDGVATTAEIDDAITHGFGLRWAQMGLFETYRVAGGEGGMRHFIAQFGEALGWPWTKLTDVPELTDELIDRIASQSDEQSGAYDIRDLERIRDRNLGAILRALETEEWGAGATLSALRRAIEAPVRSDDR